MGLRGSILRVTPATEFKSRLVCVACGAQCPYQQCEATDPVIYSHLSEFCLMSLPRRGNVQMATDMAH